MNSIAPPHPNESGAEPPASTQKHVLSRISESTPEMHLNVLKLQFSDKKSGSNKYHLLSHPSCLGNIVHININIYNQS